MVVDSWLFDGKQVLFSYVLALAVAPVVAACGAGDGESEMPQLSGGESSTGSMTPEEPPGTTSADMSVEGTSTGADSDSSGEPVLGCGNGIVEDDEQCDDANEDVCDGCEACESRLYVHLDGEMGHYLEVTDAEGEPVKLIGTPFTVEAWIRLDDNDDRVEIGRGGGESGGWSLSVSSNGLVGTFFGSATHEGGGAVAFGWHHIAWTYDGQASRLWLDGVESGMPEDIVAMVAIADTTDLLKVGAISNEDGDVVGYASSGIDELRISDSVRYIGGFTPFRRHEPDNNTLLLLHFDEGDGTSIKDASAFGHTVAESGLIWMPEDRHEQCG